MEQPNVNNLNGVPNFGHGISAQEETPEVIETPTEETPAEDEVEITNQEQE